jgi:hypothetical protein
VGEIKSFINETEGLALDVDFIGCLRVPIPELGF